MKRIDAAILEAQQRLGARINARCDAELKQVRRDAERARRSIGQRFRRDRHGSV